LPVIYLCENNQYGEYTPFRKVTAGAGIAERANPFGIPAQVVDGLDVLAVYQATQEAVMRARDGEGPSFIEAMTYRYRGHHVGDPGKFYRTEEEIRQWQEKDAIRRFAKWLVDRDVCPPEELEEIDRTTEAEIEAALEFALNSPPPDSSEVMDHVYP